MNRLLSPARPESPSDLGEPPTRQRMPQIGLSTLLLTTACIAAWGSAWMNRREIKQLEQRVASMRSLARELVVRDRDHIAIVQQHPQLYDQQIWHVHAPGDSLGLHLTTRHILPMSRQALEKHAGPVVTAPLPSGRHVIELKSELEGDEWITQAFIDDQPAITVREPKDWDAGRGSSGGGNFSEQADLPADQPAVLFSRVFMVPDGKSGSRTPTEPSNGIALWIGELRPAADAKH